MTYFKKLTRRDTYIKVVHRVQTKIAHQLYHKVNFSVRNDTLMEVHNPVIISIQMHMSDKILSQVSEHPSETHNRVLE
jgi:hypothetical protein